MDWVVIDGVRPYDGRYEFDLTDRELTTREWGWIKKYSGYMPLTIGDGLTGGDPELFSVFAVIALRRADKIQAADVPDLYERLLDSGFGSTVILETDPQADEEAADTGPPLPSSNGNEPSSGDSSPTSSETSADTQKPTGTPASATSESPPVMLAS